GHRDEKEDEISPCPLPALGEDDIPDEHEHEEVRDADDDAEGVCPENRVIPERDKNAVLEVESARRGKRHRHGCDADEEGDYEGEAQLLCRVRIAFPERFKKEI